MADFGYATVTATCPVTPADGNTTVRAFGENGTSVYKIVTCPEGHKYGIKVAITVSGVVTEYTLVEPA